MDRRRDRGRVGGRRRPAARRGRRLRRGVGGDRRPGAGRRGHRRRPRRPAGALRRRGRPRPLPPRRRGAAGRPPAAPRASGAGELLPRAALGPAAEAARCSCRSRSTARWCPPASGRVGGRRVRHRQRRRGAADRTVARRRRGPAVGGHRRRRAAARRVLRGQRQPPAGRWPSTAEDADPVLPDARGRRRPRAHGRSSGADVVVVLVRGRRCGLGVRGAAACSASAGDRGAQALRGRRPTCWPPPRRVRPTWRCVARRRPGPRRGRRRPPPLRTASARSRSCPAAPPSTPPACGATRIGIRALVARRRARARCRTPSPPATSRADTVIRAADPEADQLAGPRRPAGSSPSGDRPAPPAVRRSRSASPPSSPGAQPPRARRRRPLRRRGRPAPRRPRRGLRPARRGPAGHRRQLRRARSPVRRARGHALQVLTGLPRPTAGSRSAPASSTPCSRSAARARRRRRRHRLQPREDDADLESPAGSAQPADPRGARGRRRGRRGRRRRPDRALPAGAQPRRAARATPRRARCTVVVNRMRDSLGWAEARHRRDGRGLHPRSPGVHFLPEDRATIDRALVAGRPSSRSGTRRCAAALAELSHDRRCSPAGRSGPPRHQQVEPADRVGDHHHQHRRSGR